MLEAASEVTARRVPSGVGGAVEARRRRAPEPRRRELLARLLLMARVPPPNEGHPSPANEATAVARAWLDLIHSGRWASSWAVAGPVLKATIDQAEWQAALRSVHVTLGRCRSRELRSQTTLDGFPGVPSGPYTVIVFESRFEERDGVIETVATCRDSEGHWHPTAYFVR